MIPGAKNDHSIRHLAGALLLCLCSAAGAREIDLTETSIEELLNIDGATLCEEGLT